MNLDFWQSKTANLNLLLKINEHSLSLASYTVGVWSKSVMMWINLAQKFRSGSEIDLVYEIGCEPRWLQVRLKKKERFQGIVAILNKAKKDWEKPGPWQADNPKFFGAKYFLGCNYFWENASARPAWGSCPYLCTGKLNTGEVATRIIRQELLFSFFQPGVRWRSTISHMSSGTRAHFSYKQRLIVTGGGSML